MSTDTHQGRQTAKNAKPPKRIASAMRRGSSSKGAAGCSSRHGSSRPRSNGPGPRQADVRTLARDLQVRILMRHDLTEAEALEQIEWR